MALRFSSIYAYDVLSVSNQHSEFNQPIQSCPVDNEINKSIVEDFLTKSFWGAERSETNTVGLSVSQIALIMDPNESNVCATFNTTYTEALDAVNSIGEPLYNVTYYKTGSFYFVVVTLRQPSDPNILITGVSYIDVYDSNQSYIKGYAF